MTLEEINEIIDEENGLPVTEDGYLLDSDMDSFAYAVFWFKVEEECPHIKKEYYQNIDYVTYTVQELLDKCNEDS